jgi:hypothetical protein
MRQSRRQVRRPADLRVALVETQRAPRAGAAGRLLHAR